MPEGRGLDLTPLSALLSISILQNKTRPRHFSFNYFVIICIQESIFCLPFFPIFSLVPAISLCCPNTHVDCRTRSRQPRITASLPLTNNDDYTSRTTRHHRRVSKRSTLDYLPVCADSPPSYNCFSDYSLVMRNGVFRTISSG